MLEKEAIDALAGASNITDSIILKYPETIGTFIYTNKTNIINTPDKAKRTAYGSILPKTNVNGDLSTISITSRNLRVLSS